MRMSTINKTEYRELLDRQGKIEKELSILKEVVRRETDEFSIGSSILKKWERISRGLDQGKGRSFSSVKTMNQWLKNL